MKISNKTNKTGQATYEEAARQLGRGQKILGVTAEDGKVSGGESGQARG